MRLLIDQDFDHEILRGLERRIPDLDAVTAHEEGLGEVPDPELPAWAAQAGRILLTHDVSTMPVHVAERIAGGERVAGVFVVPRRLPIKKAVDDLEIIVLCSLENEWTNIIRFLPL